MEKYVFKDGFEASYIASRQNPRVISASKLADKKHREREKTFLCEGVKLTLEAAEFGSLAEVYIRESDAERYADAVASAAEAGGEVFVLSDGAFDKITTEKSPQGIIAVAKMREDLSSEPKGKMTLLLDCIRDPGNLGTILRSACALGGAQVVLHSCADLYNPKTVRAAMGAIFKSDVSVVADAAEYIKAQREAGRRVLAAALRSDSLYLGSYEVKRDDVIVIGNEGHGVSQDVLDACSDTVLIPMEANTESLNASVAASVILWEYARVSK